jgi:hypothetical protein
MKAKLKLKRKLSLGIVNESNNLPSMFKKPDFQSWLLWQLSSDGAVKKPEDTFPIYPLGPKLPKKCVKPFAG